MALLKKKTFVILLLFLHSLSGTVVLKDNGYENIIVAISPDVHREFAQGVINGIEAWIQEGSESLFDATNKLAYISEVKILIPHNWRDIDDVLPTNDVLYEDGSIRVEIANPLYGDAPYTVQSDRCGERGEKTVVTPNYLTNLETLSTTAFGPPANIFVHEWAKLRYGVFEEHGYPGDPIYPLFSWQLNNGVGELLPNFCTNTPVKGRMQDQIRGGECNFAEDSVLPDTNCLFIPDGDNSGVFSSFMATPFLTSTAHFCRANEREYPHNPTLQNKQNYVCNGQSTWSVIQANQDFVNVTPSILDHAPNTVFTLVRHEDQGQFVMVLDVSGSMDGIKMDKLKQSTIRWTQHDVRDGSFLGVTTFNHETVEIVPMTKINATSRDKITDELNNIFADGDTCIGDGVRQGMRTLSQTASSGGVMILFTDGQINCGVALNDTEFMQEIVDSKVRICTIAFGEQADDDLETLATISNGKTFTVFDDAGLDDINAALLGCLDFQPTLSTNETDIQIFSRQFSNYANNDGLDYFQFIVDKTIGSEVKIQIDYRNPSNIKEVHVTGPSNYDYVSTFVQNPSNVFTAELGNLELGTYRAAVVTNGIVSYAMAVVTSKPKDEATLPFTVNCWANSGTGEIDMSESRLVVVAQVKQGNSPVMDAKVVAIVEKEGQETPIHLELLDNGRNADQTANDGRYSRYFTSYDEGDGRYIITCRAEGTEDSSVHGGFGDGRQHLSKSFPLLPSMPPPCCGSNTVNENTIREPTGQFFREASGGSVKLVNVPEPGFDNLPPTKVADFSAKVVNQTILLLSFTSPGDDFDNGTAAYYDIRASENITHLFDSFDSVQSLNESNTADGYDMRPVEGGSKKQIAYKLGPNLKAKQLFVAMKTYDGTGNAADLSNVASVLLGDVEVPSKKGNLSGGEIAGIVVGSVAFVALVLTAIVVGVKWARKRNGGR